MRERLLRLFLILMSFLGFLAFSAVHVWATNEQFIYPGVTMNGLVLGEKNITKVYEILNTENQRIAAYKISLHWPDGNTVTEVNFGEVAIAVDKERVWQEAFSLGRSGSWPKRVKERWKLWWQGIEIPLYVRINEEAATKFLAKAGEAWFVAPHDAVFSITADDQVQIIPEKAGQRIAIEGALQELQVKHFKDGIFSEAVQDIHLFLGLEQIMPAKTQHDLQQYGVEGLVSRFTTNFNADKLGRTKNIRLASKKIDYVLLSPGEIFSFNAVVGPRTKEEGFDEADIILNYSFTPGVGGGVCQVSSTLYNAILLADLAILERAPHSMVISYVKPGLDATVVYGSRDFRFKNNTEKYVLLNTVVTNGSLTCKVFGKPEKGKKVVLKTYKEQELPYSNIYKEDPQIQPGKYLVERKGVTGCVIRVERQIYDSGNHLTKKEVISRDQYPPVDSIIRRSNVSAQSLSIAENL